jgi:ferredoxin
MIVNIPKPMDEVKELLADYPRVFILGCGGCPIGCESGGQKRLDELKAELARPGRTVSGTQMIDFLCNKALVGAQLRYQIPALKLSDAVLVVSCGVGVQATSAMIDIPALPANNTLNSQGMQGLWPSTERCDGCGDCVLHLTGGICPITRCAKSLLNGQCGGTHDGKCEVESNRDCAWHLIYERLKALGKLDNLKKLPRLRDYRNWDVSDKDRGTTRWSLEKDPLYKAPKSAGNQ